MILNYPTADIGKPKIAAAGLIAELMAVEAQ